MVKLQKHLSYVKKKHLSQLARSLLHAKYRCMCNISILLNPPFILIDETLWCLSTMLGVVCLITQVLSFHWQSSLLSVIVDHILLLFFSLKILREDQGTPFSSSN